MLKFSFGVMVVGFYGAHFFFTSRTILISDEFPDTQKYLSKFSSEQSCKLVTIYDLVMSHLLKSPPKTSNP